MDITTIKLEQGTKCSLDEFRESKNESYDEILKKLVYIVKSVKKNPQLSQKTIKDIEEARIRIKKGEFYTEEQMRKRLNL